MDDKGRALHCHVALLTQCDKNYPSEKKQLFFYVVLTLAAVVCFILQFV